MQCVNSDLLFFVLAQSKQDARNFRQFE